MELVKTVCPRCGSLNEAQSSNKIIYCSSCGAKLFPDDEDEHHKEENNASGKAFEEKHLRIQEEEHQKEKEARMESPKKKTNIIILALLWISFLPFMATIALAKSKKLSKIGKILAITSLWVFLCVFYMIVQLTTNTSNGTITNSTSETVLEIEGNEETNQQEIEARVDEAKKGTRESNIEKTDDAINASKKESVSSIGSELIKEKTYYLVDADYILNGLLIHIDSITLEQGYAPPGYSVYVSYSVENKNSSDAVFEFSDLHGNCVKYNGLKAILAATKNVSNIHIIGFPLKADEKREQLIGDFYVSSESYSKTIGGIKYDPISIDELYTGQEISIEFLMRGFVGGSEEDMTVTFDFKL